MPCFSLNQYKIASNVDLILIGNRPNLLSVSLVLAYLDTPTEYLQKLEYNISKSSGGNSSFFSMVKVAGVFMYFVIISSLSEMFLTVNVIPWFTFRRLQDTMLRIDNSGWSVNSSALFDGAGMRWYQRKYHVLYTIRQIIINSIY